MDLETDKPSDRKKESEHFDGIRFPIVRQVAAMTMPIDITPVKLWDIEIWI